LKVTPCYFTDTALANMPHFSKLVAAYEYAGCSKWFIIVSPPSKILGSEKRLPTGPDSEAEKKALGEIVSNERHFRHRDWQLPPNSGVVILSDPQADKENRRVWTSSQGRNHRVFTFLLTSCTALLRTALKRTGAGSQAQLAVAYLVRMGMKYEAPPAMMPHGRFQL
jgi:hypothetical protein